MKMEDHHSGHLVTAKNQMPPEAAHSVPSCVTRSWLRQRTADAAHPALTLNDGTVFQSLVWFLY